MNKLLNQKIALITGGSSGIGEAIVRQFIESGAQVYFTFCTSQGRAEKIAAETGAVPIKCDVRDESQIGEVVTEILDKKGRVDVLVNNAGAFEGAFLTDKNFGKVWKDVLQTNLESVRLLTEKIAPSMKKQRSGKIINISSVSGMLSIPRNIPYGTAKAAIDGFTRHAAFELAKFGIQVNSIAPSSIKTPVWAKDDNEVKREIEKRIRCIPSGDFGRPEDIAGTALFLASDLTNFLIGQSIIVDGGISINYFEQ